MSDIESNSIYATELFIFILFSVMYHPLNTRRITLVWAAVPVTLSANPDTEPQTNSQIFKSSSNNSYSTIFPLCGADRWLAECCSEGARGLSGQLGIEPSTERWKEEILVVVAALQAICYHLTGRTKNEENCRGKLSQILPLLIHFFKTLVLMWLLRTGKTDC